MQVGGVPVGQRHRNRADARTSKRWSRSTSNPRSTPLHQGTTAEVRVPSLSSVANRYIALSPGPNNNPALPDGATLPGERDQRSHRPRPALQHAQPEDAQGPAAVHPGHRRTVCRRGQGSSANRPNTSRRRSARPTTSSPSSSSDQPTFTNFLVETAKAVTTIGARKEQLADLIENANTTFQAIGSQQAQLARGPETAPAHPAPGQHDLRRACPPRSRRSRSSSKPPSPTTEPLTTLLAAPAPARHHGHARSSRNFSQRDQQARRQQRPDRTRSARCRRSPRR